MLKSLIVPVLFVLMGYIVFGVFMKSKANSDVQRDIMPIVPALESTNPHKDNWQAKEHSKKKKKVSKKLP